MKKFLVILCTLIVGITACFSLVACGEKYPTITFMDGDTQIVAVSSQKDFDAQLEKCATKVGNKFLGYFLDKECTIPFDENNMPEGDFKLYTSWLALDGYSKVTVSADATINVGTAMGLDADATVLYRETAEGFDFIIDAKANVAGIVYNAKIYYVDGVIVAGASEGDEPLEYETEDIGTVKELIEEVKEELFADPQIKAAYDLVVEILAENGVTLDATTIKQLFVLPANININESIDIAQDVTDLIDAIIAIKDTPIYDLILSAIVLPEEIEDTKLAVDEFLTELFDDEITVEGFINKLLGLVDLDVEQVLAAIDELQEANGIKTQDVIDLINIIAETELPDAQEGQTITAYVSELVGLEEILEAKVNDLLVDIIDEEAKLSDLLPLIKSARDTTTVGDVLELVVDLFDDEIGLDEVLTIADSIVFEKLEFAAEVKTDANGLLTKLALGTDDSITLDEDTYTVDIDLAIDLEYGLYGENVFALPEIAE